MTEDQEARLREMWQAGESEARIARILEVAPRVVRKARIEMGYVLTREQAAERRRAAFKRFNERRRNGEAAIDKDVDPAPPVTDRQRHTFAQARENGAGLEVAMLAALQCR